MKKPIGAVPASARHSLDEGALLAYLSENFSENCRGLTLLKFEGGQSNPTYYMELGTDAYVLRKKPVGKLMPKAHAVDREFKVLSALAATDVQVPKVRHFCSDETVIGTPFYLMDYMQGRIFRDPMLPDLKAVERTAIYSSMNDTLARLHSVDWQAVGLEDFGRPDNYLSRQVALWTKQYQATKSGDVPALEKLMRWLPLNIPDDDSSSIVHGDFRIENLMFHETEPRVIAILDWELSTIGHPLSDLAYNCMTYHLPQNNAVAPGFLGVDLSALGLPTERDYVSEYCKRTGRDEVADWAFFMAFSLFRTAAIQQGVYHRALKGNASSRTAHMFGETYPLVAEQGWRLVENLGD